MVNYITDEVKALIGLESEWEEGCDPVERGQIRRHFQATMDNDPVYWDDAHAAGTKFGSVVAPPLFPLHVLRPAPGTPDPFERAAKDPDFDGSVRGLMKGLKPLPIPLTRVLNGGNEVEIYQQAKPGETVRVRSKYLDIYQKEGRTGTMVFLLTETVYTNGDGELLLKAIQTRILR
ncbi:MULTISPECIES: MaoC family dehydratase N-terminal domain-containing protein [unclassified Mesorhizobium]|uniref:FAS1-like dehydratase domain-containing protein n=1 Tax=unclassified Mesorhizobium TaxID=325217 RepID=UPI00112783F8|nr:MULTISPECIES: MaoC family dehydratase N-terminal domain-containing protein [unclassified Mesorhizobium]MBZ9894355.1 MaoC family dehydratase N-terminal domain-containing protein [Mesorhizobium sp. BR1-1-6]TPM57686.1 MaoC family dehydratase [Mesorhizobium sp. B2-2-4]TPM65511.1 MaoC family dehydratase [Mesorhizobium sp. B2-2-1]TPM98486.1 MaoC family dehydratase [Mesorhizobium sp. B2-1-5]TPN38579.1 MaoC family dehydratase [Mesorhizobium sp. B1-1-6]